MANNVINIFMFTSSFSYDTLVELANENKLVKWYYLEGFARYYIPIEYKDDAVFMNALYNVNKIFNENVRHEMFTDKYYSKKFKEFNIYTCRITHLNMTFEIYWASNYEGKKKK